MGLITVLSHLELAQIRISMLRLDSSNLSTAQKNYGITDKEGLAIVWAVRKW